MNCAGCGLEISVSVENPNMWKDATGAMRCPDGRWHIPEIPDPTTPLQGGAAQMREMYLSLVEVDFTDRQALWAVCFMTTAGQHRPPDSEP